MVTPCRPTEAGRLLYAITRIRWLRLTARFTYLKRRRHLQMAVRLRRAPKTPRCARVATADCW